MTDGGTVGGSGGWGVGSYASSGTKWSEDETEILSVM